MSSANRLSCFGPYVGALAGFGLLIGGCEPSPKSKPAFAVEEPADAAPTQVAQQQAERKAPGPLPKDLDVAALSKKLGCGRVAKVKHACRVLKEFEQAGRWIWPAQSPEARWAGNAYVVGKDDKNKKDGGKKVMVLYGRQVPTMQVGPDLLALKFGAGMLSDALGAARWKLVDGISRLSRVPRKNPALVAAQSFIPETQRNVQATDGASILWVADDKAYFRQQGRKVLVLELSPDPTDQHGEGTYAELWPVYW
jgi:hypothetical protein